MKALKIMSWICIAVGALALLIGDTATVGLVLIGFGMVGLIALASKR